MIPSIPAKQFMTKTKLSEFACNPYVGCTHGCVYCYAKHFEKRFPLSSWGTYVYERKFPHTRIPKGTGRASLMFSPMTDPYQPVEETTSATRKILESIVESQLQISILTKSDLVLRDMDLFLRMNSVEVGFSIGMDDPASTWFEPGASTPRSRVKALQKLHEQGIRTYVFFAPLLPGISDIDTLFDLVKDHVDYLMVDRLNIKDSIDQQALFQIARRFGPEVENLWQQVFLQHNDTWYQETLNHLKKRAEQSKIELRYTP